MQQQYLSTRGQGFLSKDSGFATIKKILHCGASDLLQNSFGMYRQLM
jgi:hypothetical protein